MFGDRTSPVPLALVEVHGTADPNFLGRFMSRMVILLIRGRKVDEMRRRSILTPLDPVQFIQRLTLFNLPPCDTLLASNFDAGKQTK